MKFALAVVTAVALAPPLLAEQAADPFGWLEDIEGAKALDWARAENARTLPVLEGDPRFAQMRAEALDPDGTDAYPDRFDSQRRRLQLLAG